MSPQTPSPLRRFVRDSGITLVQQSATALCTLVTAVTIARTLGPAGQGVYGVAFSLAVLTMTVGNLGIGPATVYYVSSGAFTPKLAARQSVLLALGLSLVLGAAVSAGVAVWGAHIAPGVPSGLLFGAVALLPALLANNFLVAVLQGAQRFGAYNRASLLAPLCVSVGSLVALPELELGVGGALGAQAFGNIVGALFAWRALRADGEPGGQWRPSRLYARTLVGYGLQAYVGNALSYLSYRIDVFLLNAWASASAVGIYAIATGVGERLWLLSIASSVILLPRVANPQAGGAVLTPVISRHVLALGALGALGLAAVAPWLLPWVFGPGYADAVRPLWALLPGVVCFSAGRILSNDIAGRGRPGINARLGALTLAVNVAANTVLIPRMGATGAALASSIAYCLDSFCKAWVYCRLSGVRARNVLWLQADDLARLRVWAGKLRLLAHAARHAEHR